MASPIQFSQNDTATLVLTASDGNGNPINITGASFSTQILGPNGAIAVFGNAKHTIVNAVLGQFQLALLQTDTAQCATGSSKDIVTQITIGASSVYFRGNGIVTVYPPVPNQ
jgi:hypothetical protein